VAESGENTIDGEVVAVEPLGGFTIVDIHAGQGLLKMRLPSQVRFAERELVHLGLDASKTRLFDAAGNSIPRIELMGNTVPFDRSMQGRRS
jgi:ABC-type sugar transport system ATPase subunit